MKKVITIVLIATIFSGCALREVGVLNDKVNRLDWKTDKQIKELKVEIDRLKAERR